MAGACSFDESQLRLVATPTPDGATEHPVVLDASASGSDGATASSPDAVTGAGGRGGVGADASAAGVDGSTKFPDSAVLSDLGTALDVAIPPDVAQQPDVGPDAPLTVDATSIPDMGLIPDVTFIPDTGTGPPNSGDGGASDGAGGTDSSPTLCSPVPKSTGGIACPGGRCTVGPYSGSGFTVSDGLASTICLSANSLCAAGTTNALKSSDISANWGAVFGFYLSPDSTAANPVGVQLAGSGISATMSSLPIGAQAGVQVTVGNAAYYCATMSASSQTFPWASFNTACWNNSGTYLTGAPTAATQIVIKINSEAGVAGSFDFCVTSLAFPGSETCPTGYHDDGTGTCVLIGACSTGYHDGGGGTCVALEPVRPGTTMAGQGRAWSMEPVRLATTTVARGHAYSSESAQPGTTTAAREPAWSAEPARPATTIARAHARPAPVCCLSARNAHPEPSAKVPTAPTACAVRAPVARRQATLALRVLARRMVYRTASAVPDVRSATVSTVTALADATKIIMKGSGTRKE